MAYKRILLQKNIYVHSYEIHTSKSEYLRGMRILHLSDLHFRTSHDGRCLSEYLGHIKKSRYDLVILTGDLIENARHGLEGCHKIFLNSLSAEVRSGKLAVLGNHDRMHGTGINGIAAELKHSGFRLLINESVMLKFNEKEFCVAGIDDWMYGEPDYEAALMNISPEVFSIVCVHSLDRKITGMPGDLWLSGHLHAGEFAKMGLLALKALGNYKDPYRQVAGIYNIGSKVSIVHPGMASHFWVRSYARLGTMPEGIVEIKFI